MSSFFSSNVTAGFIDLATYDDLDAAMYGGACSAAYFVGQVTKSTWFTTVPVLLGAVGGTAGFGSTSSWKLSRAADYALHLWLRVVIPSVTASATGVFGGFTRLRWTRNLMHNLIESLQFSANELPVQTIDSYYLDFWSAFTVPAGKRNGYNNMIGNIPSLTNPSYSISSGVVNTLPEGALNLPLPLFFTSHSGVALPTAALPYNELTVKVTFRNWTQLLIADAVGGTSVGVSTAASLQDISGGVAPVLNNNNVALWAHYAIVSNQERAKMGCAPRDILITQSQTIGPQSVNPSTSSSVDLMLNFAQAIKAFFFSIQNTTNAAERSNYTCGSPVISGTTGVVNFSPDGATDPYKSTGLTYDSTHRFNLPVDYYSLMNPYFHAIDIPSETGYHLYSYTLDLVSPDPMGSTDYGKLQNVKLASQLSDDAVSASSSTGTIAAPDAALLPKGWGLKQTFAQIAVGLNWNVIRVVGGALGFPIL